MARAQYQQWLKPENLTLLQGWARNGLTLEQIAHNMGIIPGTLWTWRQKYKEIEDALSKGREICYFEVENALYKSAMGYECKEIEQVENYDADGVLVSKSRRVRTRHIPANLGAQCFILKNIQPDKWQDKPERVAKDDIADDGFIDALTGTAAEDWQDDDNIADIESGDPLEE